MDAEFERPNGCHMFRSTRVRPGLLAVIATLGVVLGLTVPAQAAFGPTNTDTETVTGQFMPTWQTNGTVWNLAIAGDVVYVGGNFTAVRPPGSPPGQDEVERLRLAAFDVHTGALLPWAPKATASVVTIPAGSTPDKNCTITATTYECATVWDLTVTPDGKYLIVGGDFTKIDGQWRVNLAAFSTATGQLVSTFQPKGNGRVYAVAATNTTVYAGGPFTKFNGVERAGLAALDLPSGTLQPQWAPTVTKGASSIIKWVRSMALTQDGTRLIVGGGFDKLNDTVIHGLGAIDTATGGTARFDARRIVGPAFVTSVRVDGDTVYSTADALGSASEGVIAYDAATGAEQWYDSCRGASHSMAVLRGVVYSGSHAHDCGVMDDAFGEQYQGYSSGDRRRYTLRAEIPNGTGGARLLHWYPRTNDGNGARTMEASQDQLWVGGEFTYLDNTTYQQGLTRYVFADSGGANRKPFKPTAPVVASNRAGQIDIAFRQTEDPDQRDLTYEVYRNGNTSSPVFRTSSSGKPWLQEWLRFTDRSVTPGTTYTYDVRAIDPLGTKSTRSSSVTVTAAQNEPAVADLAKNDRALLQYSYESLNATGRFVDGVSGRLATKGTKVTNTASGTAATGKALLMTGVSGQAVVDTTRFYSPRAASVEAMFNTTTTRGGVIASLGDSSSTTGLSSNNTLNVYMDNAGRINAGVRPDGQRTDVWANPFSTLQAVTTASPFNDGRWHHVVVTFEPGTGTRIYVDGVLQAANPALNWSRAVNAYFRVGGDRTAGWPNAPASSWFTGAIDEAAFYTYPLSEAQIAQHAEVLLSKLAAPRQLAASATGPEDVALTWGAVKSASTYRVFRDGQQVAETADLSWNDTGLKPRTEYSYTVQAVAGGETSAMSDEVKVSTPAPPPQTVIQTGSEWRYGTSGQEAQGWTSNDFDDSAWLSGPSKLGFGETDEATKVPDVTPSGARRATTYFRNAFDVTDAAAARDVTLKVRRDDGIIVYLNGQEVYRDNMPLGPVTSSTLATTWAPDDGTKWLTAVIPARYLAEGRNTVSVEVHQNALSSVDMSFDMQLTVQK